MIAHRGGEHIDLDLWRRGRARLVECSGRARIHDLRNALNAVAIGVELLANDDSDGGQPARVLRAAAVRREIGIAGSEVAGLSTLFAETTTPSFSLLPDVIRWALEVAEPVGRRRGVQLETSSAAELPDMDLPVGANVALALLLVESCLTARRGSQCAARLVPDPMRMTIEWRSETQDGSAGLDFACALFRDVMGDKADAVVRHQGDLQELVAVLEPAR